MAPVRTSGYVPLFSALTSYSAWLWLNCFTSSLTVSPSWPPIACQNEISVFASDSLGPTTSAAATTATAQAQRFMRALQLIAAPRRAGPQPREARGAHVTWNLQGHPCQVRRTIAHGPRRPGDAGA